MRTLLPLIACAALTATGFAQMKYPPEMPGARVETYKTVGDVKLNVWIFSPEGHKATDKRPAIVFFFGGGWTSGTPAQFLHQSQHLASRGMVAIAADYRVGSRQDVKVKDCVEDAKDAVAWVRKNAARLGVDPKRIAAGGGSAGGHLAAATATLPGFGKPGANSMPNALVLFNPALVLAPVPGMSSTGLEKLGDRLGAEPEAVSPYHHVRKGLPPAIIFHGKADTTVPYRTVELFCEAMTKAGNRCEVMGFEGAKHGFFNYGRGDEKAYAETVAGMDKFLSSLGWL
jgi:acetyl esterase/lipase